MDTYKHIKVIAFDADDTLWVNETYYREAEKKFMKLLSGYETENMIDQELFKTEMDNLHLYGYGIKSFVLSMIETALHLSNYSLNPKIIDKIIDIGREMLEKPLKLLDDVEFTLKTLHSKYKLILVTKGDLLDQERKLKKSKLMKYFHHIEILSDKKTENYQSLLDRLEISNTEFLMVGNSLKSDVLPLLKIGAQAIHIPFHTTWIHEEVKDHQNNGEYKSFRKLKDILPYL
jgi:putative hydrolase of the HAD superfamily